MVSPQKFQGMIASIFPSQSAEVILEKQPILASYGREIHSIINQLPSETAYSLFAKYSKPTSELITQLEEAFISRELMTDLVIQEVGIDKKWFESVNTLYTNEKDTNDIDEWNISSSNL